MVNHKSLSKSQLVALLEQQNTVMRERDVSLQLKDKKIQELTQERDDYKLAFNKLMEQRFRNRSERYIANPDQLRLDFGDSDEGADAALGLAEAVEERDVPPARQKRKVTRRTKEELFPPHWPRIEVTAEVPDSVRHCDKHGERTLLPESMWDRREKMVFERPRAHVLVTKFPKYACANQSQCGIASPERPAGLVEGDRYDTSIAAEIIAGKYAYHLPLYRLQDYFSGCGWTPSRSTQCNILASAFELVKPLLEHFKSHVQADHGVGCDDTGVTLLYPKTIPPFDLADPKQQRIHEVFSKALAEGKSSINAKMWVYRGLSVKINLFDFTVSRHRDGPQLFFRDYEGKLLGDCWHGFEAIASASEGHIDRCACNAHARRKFENSSAYPQDRAQWLAWYQQLYDIEDRARDLPSEQRQELRQQESGPIWAAITTWLEEIDLRTKNVILPKSDLAKAINYVRNHLTELQRYLDDGLLPIDNNDTEQLMRQVAIGRKNWIFAGSVNGGERNAAFLTLASCAIRNDLDVWVYVKDVLDQLLTGSTDYDSLLPEQWAARHPESIRQYRAEERRRRAARTKARRAKRRTLR